MPRPIQFKIPSSSSPPAPFSFPDGFAGGMNISVSADQIALNQSPDMLNMNYDAGGVPTHRFGFERLNAESWGVTPIRGMYEYHKIDGTAVFLVAWGGKIWSYNIVTDTKTDLMTGSKASIEDAVTIFFTMGDKVYIKTPFDYCVYDGTNPVEDVVGYIPTISLSRTPDGVATENEELNYLSNSWKDSFNGDGMSTAYQLSFTGLSATTVKAWIDGVEKIEDTDFTVDRTNGIVNWGSAPPSGTNNVVIQAEKDGLMDATMITKCTIHTIYGGKNDTRVFFAGHPELLNWRFHSALFDPTYFPESNYVLVGSDAEAITDFGRMIDYLIIYKERRAFYSYIEGPNNDGKVYFPVLPLNDEYGCIAPRTVQPAQGGLLALSEEGVTWTIPSMVRGQLNVKVVSRNINKRSYVVYGLLDNTKDDLKNAHAIIYDEKYMLHIKDKVWVLDLRFSDLSRGECCWYPYDGIPGKASCFIEKDEDLYIGDKEQGLIYKSQSRYLDDGEAIDAYWTSPLLFVGGRDWIKKFERLNVTFMGQPEGNHTLTIITDQGTEDILLLIQDERVFDYGIIDYGSFTYGIPLYPSTQSEKVGYKGEYLQWKIRNNQPDEDMTILAQSLQYSLRKRVK